MLLAHAVALAEARSYVAALADTAQTFDAAIEYEQILLEFDTIHGGQTPPTSPVPSGDREVLYAVAEVAISELSDHGVDPLQIELILAALEGARELDRP